MDSLAMTSTLLRDADGLGAAEVLEVWDFEVVDLVVLVLALVPLCWLASGVFSPLAGADSPPQAANPRTAAAKMNANFFFIFY